MSALGSGRQAGKTGTSFGPFILVGSAAVLVLGEYLGGPGFGLLFFATAAMVVGGVVSLLAWYGGVRRQAGRIGLWDVAGAMLLVGFAAAILGEPERLLAISNL